MIPAAPAALTLVRPMYFFESTTRALFASLVFGSVLLATTPVRSAAQAAARSNPASYTTAQAEQGKMIFDETCSRCHSSVNQRPAPPSYLPVPLWCIVADIPAFAVGTDWLRRGKPPGAQR